MNKKLAMDALKFTALWFGLTWAGNLIFGLFVSLASGVGFDEIVMSPVVDISSSLFSAYIAAVICLRRLENRKEQYQSLPVRGTNET